MNSAIPALAGALLAGAAFTFILRRKPPKMSTEARRIRLLSTIVHATGSIGKLDTHTVLEAVADASIALTYDGVAICRFDESGESYRILTSRGLPPEYAGRVHPSSTLMTRLVQERHETVVVNDYSEQTTAIPIIREAGFNSVVGTPVWVSGRLAAVICAGFRGSRSIEPEEIEALELLALKAGVALTNAEAFESERRTVARLNDLDRMKDDFLSTVSHELRTPLTAIEAAGFTLEERWNELPEDLKMQLLSRLNANARTLEDIITSLLDFARMTGGKPNASIAPVDLGTVLETAALRVSGLFAGRTLTVDVARELTVQADAMLIDRVIENLLSNAAKHTHKGAHVVLTATIEKGSALVTVVDDGPGIPTDEMPYISDRFFRGAAASVHRTRGLGLGLSLVKAILEVHGSTLEVESTPGKGATFSFVLPLSRFVVQASPQVPSVSHD